VLGEGSVKLLRVKLVLLCILKKSVGKRLKEASMKTINN